MSVFHRIVDPMALSGPKLMKLAERLVAYDGAVAFRLRLMNAEQQPDVDLEQDTAPPPQIHIHDSVSDRAAPSRGGGAGQPIPRHSYTEIPEILLPGPQIEGAEVIPAIPAALALSDIGHLFSFATA